MVSGKEWKLPMVAKFWQQEELKEEKDFLFPAKNHINKILVNK